MTATGAVDVDAFLGGKTRLARALARGECGGKYEDAVLIVSSIFSAFSAHFWPRPGDYPWDETEFASAEDQTAADEIRSMEKKKWVVPDTKRFVEFWVTYASPNLGSNRISVPLLAQDVFRKGDTASLRNLKAIRPELLRYAPAEIDWSVATGHDDADETEVTAACPNLALAQIRKFSYAAVFYREIRSAYVHELGPGKHASQIPGGKTGAPITYRNFGSPPHHRVHFEIEWLCNIAESCARRAHVDWQRSSKRCAIKWWVDGA